MATRCTLLETWDPGMGFPVYSGVTHLKSALRGNVMSNSTLRFFPALSLVLGEGLFPAPVNTGLNRFIQVRFRAAVYRRLGGAVIDYRFCAGRFGADHHGRKSYRHCHRSNRRRGAQGRCAASKRGHRRRTRHEVGRSRRVCLSRGECGQLSDHRQAGRVPHSRCRPNRCRCREDQHSAGESRSWRRHRSG